MNIKKRNSGKSNRSLPKTLDERPTQDPEKKDNFTKPSSKYPCINTKPTPFNKID